jgi:cytoskeletal protein CcmA (bactofilin family)
MHLSGLGPGLAYVQANARRERLMNHAGEASTERVSLLGPRSVLNGNISTSENLVILGQLDGKRVNSPHITVGPTARVRADLRGDIIHIEGSVSGNVHATSEVVIHASAQVQGNIHSPQIAIKDGAVVNGTVNRSSVAPANARSSEARDAEPWVRQLAR